MVCRLSGTPDRVGNQVLVLMEEMGRVGDMGGMGGERDRLKHGPGYAQLDSVQRAWQRDGRSAEG